MVMVVAVAIVAIVSSSSSSSSFATVMMAIVGGGVAAVTRLLAAVAAHWLRIFLLRPTIIVPVVGGRATLVPILTSLYCVLTAPFYALHSLQALQAHRILAIMGPRSASSSALLSRSITIALTVATGGVGSPVAGVGVAAGTAVAVTTTTTTTTGTGATVIGCIVQLLIRPVVPGDVTGQDAPATDTSLPATAEQITIRTEQATG
uniref:Putative secreted peptide n=1 Tax=Anopheles braziliensis TaxID=58242 RepID=A0A2M3ZPV3_9DIPT